MAVISEQAVSGGNSRAAYLNFLKTEYFPLLNKWVPVGSVIASHIAKPAGQMGGIKMLTSVVTALPQSSGVARGEGWDMPVPTSTRGVQPELISRSNYWRLRWTGQVITAARKGNTVAWRKPRELDLELAREQFDLNFARQLYNGPFDVVGVIKTYTDGGGSTDALTLYGRNARTSAANDFAKFGAHYLRQNMYLALVHNADGMGGSIAAGNESAMGSANAFYISAEPDDSDPDNPAITVTEIASTAPPADGDFLIPYASREDAISATPQDAISEYFGPNGLANMALDDEIYPAVFGLDKDDAPGLMPLTLRGSNGTRTFTERYIELLMTRVREKSGSAIDKLLLHDATMREVAKENRGDRRFGPVLEGQSGHKTMGVVFGDLMSKYEADWLCQPGLVWALRTEDFGWYEEWPLQPIDDGDRWVENKDQREIIAKRTGNGFCNRPFAQACADDFTFDCYDLVQ